MLLEELRRLFRYDEWANREVIAVLRSMGAPPPRSLKLLAHIVAAEQLWLDRLKQEPQSMPVWPELTLDQSEDAQDALARRWAGYFGGLTGTALHTPVAYTNSKGEKWSSRAQDTLLHVIMHSGYHRGQIATDVRAAGHTPAYTDFIHAVRQGFIE
jgi:uncharacterized damage-inducible protein DinB